MKKASIAVLSLLFCCILSSCMADNGKEVSPAVGYLSTLSVNSNNVFAVDNEGKLWGWGQNLNNVFGTDDSEALSPIVVFDSVKSVSNGGGLVLAIRQDDTLWGCGTNLYGQLGLGTNTENESPPIKIMDDVIAAGGSSVVLKKDGSLWATGSNYDGVLGNGTRTYSPTTDFFFADDMIYNDSNEFIKVMENIRDFNANGRNIAAVDLDNKLWVWGRNLVDKMDMETGEQYTCCLIVDDEEQKTVNKPYRLMGNVRYACFTTYCLYILKLDGELIEWESPSSQRTLLSDVRSFDARGMTIAAITNEDSLVCWGLQFTGQRNSMESQVSIAENVAYAAVSSDFVAYIDKQNDLYCVGRNFNGIAGNGEKATPVFVELEQPYPFIESEYVYPPVKVLSNIAYGEMPVS